jgi:hypothetical protein
MRRESWLIFDGTPDEATLGRVLIYLAFGATRGRASLEQSSPRVILEQLSVANVAPQGIHRFVA